MDNFKQYVINSNSPEYIGIVDNWAFLSRYFTDDPDYLIRWFVDSPFAETEQLIVDANKFVDSRPELSKWAKWVIEYNIETENCTMFDLTDDEITELKKLILYYDTTWDKLIEDCYGIISPPDKVPICIAEHEDYCYTYKLNVKFINEVNKMLDFKRYYNVL